MVDKSFSFSKMTVFETLDSERRQKWRQDVTKQVFLLFANAGGDI